MKVLSDLQDFDESLSIDQILAVQAQKCISNVVSGRTALVVFGDTKLRASIVNEILGEFVVVCVCACVLCMYVCVCVCSGNNAVGWWPIGNSCL